MKQMTEDEEQFCRTTWAVWRTHGLSEHVGLSVTNASVTYEEFIASNEHGRSKAIETFLAKFTPDLGEFLVDFMVNTLRGADSILTSKRLIILRENKKDYVAFDLSEIESFKNKETWLVSNACLILKTNTGTHAIKGRQLPLNDTLRFAIDQARENPPWNKIIEKAKLAPDPNICVGGPFTIEVDVINKWREKQRFALESDPLPTMPEFQTGRSPGKRIFHIVLAVVSFAIPVALFFLFLVPFASRLGGGVPTMLAYFAFIAITGAVWKVAFPSLFRGIGMSTNEDFTWRAAKYYQIKGPARAAARYYLEVLTSPWEKLINPRGFDIYRFWEKEKNTNKVGDDFLALLSDLLFVELWLEVALNSDSAFSGAGDAYRTLLPEVVTNSERLVEFATLMREMGENQLGNDGKHHSVILKLAEVFKEKAPRASEMVVSSHDSC
jgi:hypothetical protein